MKLEDVQAIVTGAASGIGRCIALELARAGALVLGGDIDVARLQELEVESANLPGKIYGVHLDVANESLVKSFVELAFEKLGSANTLVNNAGILRDGLLDKAYQNKRKYITRQFTFRCLTDFGITSFATPGT